MRVTSLRKFKQVEEVPGPVLGQGQRKKKILEWYGLDLCLWESKYMTL